MCWDFESYSTNLVTWNLPWQVSWFVFDLEREYEFHDYYVKWPHLGAPSKEVQEITGYSQKRMDTEGRDPLEVYNLFAKDLTNTNYMILGHNLLGFDTYVAKQFSDELGMKEDFSYTERIIDSLALAKAYRFEKPIDRENFSAWQWKTTTFYTKGRGMKCKLNELAKEFDIPVDENRLHQADYDVKLNAEVFKKLIWKLEV